MTFLEKSGRQDNKGFDMKLILENWREYREDILNELMPDSMDPAVPSIMDAEDAEKEARRLKKKYYDPTVKKHSAFRQRTVKGKDPESPPVKISGVPGGDESYGTGDPEALDAARQELKGTRGRGRGALYSDEELDTAQMAGEIGLMPAEAAIAGGLAGAQAAAYATPAAAALAAGEVAVAAADSPYLARPGREEQYRPQSDKNLATYFRSRRIQRRTDPKLQSKASLLKDLEGVKKYIQKTASGNIIIRGGGSKGVANAADRAKLSGLLASEVKANFLDIRKRLLALKKKPSTITPEVRGKLVAQAKKLGIDPKKYIANMPGERRRRMAAALASLKEEKNKMKVTKSRLQHLIKEEYKKILFKESIARLIDLTNEFKRLGRGFKMAAKDVSVVEELINTRQINIEDLPQGFAEKFREAGRGLPDDLPGTPSAKTVQGAVEGTRVGNKVAGRSPVVNKSGELNGIWVDQQGRAFVTLETAEGPAIYMYSSGTSYLHKSPEGFLEASPRMWLPIKGWDGAHYPKYTVGDPGFGKGRPELWDNFYNIDRNHLAKVDPADVADVNPKYLIRDERTGEYSRKLGAEWDDYFSSKYGDNWPQMLARENERKMPQLFDEVTDAIQSGVVKKQPSPQKFGKYPEKGSEHDRIAQELLKFSPDGTVTPKLTQTFGGVKRSNDPFDMNDWKKGEFVDQSVKESTQRIKLKIILG